MSGARASEGLFARSLGRCELPGMVAAAWLPAMCDLPADPSTRAICDGAGRGETTEEVRQDGAATERVAHARRDTLDALPAVRVAAPEPWQGAPTMFGVFAARGRGGCLGARDGREPGGLGQRASRLGGAVGPEAVAELVEQVAEPFDAPVARLQKKRLSVVATHGMVTMIRMARAMTWGRRR
jgi:hypothetical protein